MRNLITYVLYCYFKLHFLWDCFLFTTFPLKLLHFSIHTIQRKEAKDVKHNKEVSLKYMKIFEHEQLIIIELIGKYPDDTDIEIATKYLSIYS